MSHSTFLISGRSVISRPFKPLVQVTHLWPKAWYWSWSWVIHAGHTWHILKIKNSRHLKVLEKCFLYGSLVRGLYEGWSFKRKNTVNLWNPHWLIFVLEAVEFWWSSLTEFTVSAPFLSKLLWLTLSCDHCWSEYNTPHKQLWAFTSLNLLSEQQRTHDLSLFALLKNQKMKKMDVDSEAMS